MVTATKSLASSKQSVCSMKSCSPQSVNAARRVSKKYRNAALHKKEYKRLKRVLPQVCDSPKVSKVELIEEAIRYIDYLHTEITSRFFSNGQFNQAAQNNPMAPIVRQLYPTHPPAQVMPPLIPVPSCKYSNANIRIRL